MSTAWAENSELSVIDVTDASYWQDPHSILREARRRHPMAVASTGEPVVLRYADLERLASEPLVESNALAFIERYVESGPLVDWWRLMLTNLNGPGHTRLRGLVSRAFTPRTVDAQRNHIRTMTRELVMRRADHGEMDILQDLAHELPIRLICEILGVPPEHHADFSRWSTQLGQALSSVMTPEIREAGERAATNLSGDVLDLLRQRRRAPRDDLLSALIRTSDEMDDRFSDQDLLVLVINLIFGGHDSSRSMLTVAIALLLQNPDQLQRLIEKPSLAQSAGEEVLRCEPIVPVLSRECSKDLVVADITLPAGQPFFLSILAANRDPEVFANPDLFDISRSGPRSFSFGWGVHHCLGAALARAEIQEVIPTFFAMFREVDLMIETPRWVPFANLRRIESLPVRFDLA
ncbi:cytochrome P450 [Myxococcota bacterium]|nr:cytochrome P450 [Myxococcota bacterium]